MSCPGCVTGSVHVGTPQGTETKVGGINAYVVGDADSQRVIVFGCDIFGWRFVNNRLLADEYASHGFRVVVPDFFDGWELPRWTLNANDPVRERKSLFTRFVLVPLSLFVIAPWVLRNLPRQVSAISTVTAALRARTPSPKVGYVGFCWGGRFAISQNHLFDATVSAHPGLVKFPNELDGIKMPFSLAVAADDPYFDRTRAQETERILKERGLTDVQVVVYEGVQHGWTARANLAHPVQKKARDDAVKQVVNWFGRHLS